MVQTHQIAGWFSLFGYLGHAVAHGFNVFDMLLVSAAVLHVYVSIREQKLQKQKTFSERRNRRL